MNETSGGEWLDRRSPTVKVGAPHLAPNFDHAKYDAIGESDRMTLRFRKPD